MPSISSSSASLRSSSDAATLCPIWPGCDAPTIHRVDGGVARGSRRSPVRAHPRPQTDPGPSFWSRWTTSRFRWKSSPLKWGAPLRHVHRGEGGVLVHGSREQRTVGQGPVDEHTDVCVPRSRAKSRPRCRGGRGCAAAAGSLLANSRHLRKMTEVGDADMADLAFVDPPLERPSRSQRTGASRSGQCTWKRSTWSTPSASRLLLESLAKPVRAGIADKAVVGHPQAFFGRDHHLVAAMLDVFAESAFPRRRRSRSHERCPTGGPRAAEPGESPQSASCSSNSPPLAPELAGTEGNWGDLQIGHPPSRTRTSRWMPPRTPSASHRHGAQTSKAALFLSYDSSTPSPMGS